MPEMFNPFSQDIKADIEDDGYTGIVLEESKESEYFELMKRFPNIRFCMTDRLNGTFEVHCLGQVFECENKSELLKLFLPSDAPMKREVAEIMVRCMRLLAFNQQGPAQIVTQNTAHEQLLLFACVDMRHKIKARTHEQRQRLLHFLKERNHGGIDSAIVEARQDNEIYPVVAQSAEDMNLLTVKAQVEAREQQFTHLIIEQDHNNFFFNLLKEYGEVAFKMPENGPYMHIHLGGDVEFKVEHRLDQFSLTLLNGSSMKVGMPEFLSDLADKLQGTPEEQRKKREFRIRGSDRTIEGAFYKALTEKGRNLKTRTPKQAARFAKLQQSRQQQFSMFSMPQQQQTGGNDYGAGR